MSVHHIIILPVKFRKIRIEKYMKMSLIYYFFLQIYRGEGSRGGDVRRVVLREEREEERYVIQSITFQDQVSL